MLPFFANYSQDLLWQFDFTKDQHEEQQQQVLDEEHCTWQVSAKMKEIAEHLQVEILWAQYRQQEYTDNRCQPAPIFKVGDKVWFNAQNVTT